MHGLVIGKFYPPHRGHRYLIETAASQVKELTVVLCGHSSQDISPELRAKWLQKLHPNVSVLVLDTNQFNTNSSQAWAEAIKRLVGKKIDYMFSSEEYGDQYAPLLEAQHVMVDRYRIQVPCSASDIRANPTAYLQYLDEPVRSYFLGK